MVIARNIGRLGNNMFQISAALGYARKYGHQWAADENSGVGEPYSAIHHVFPNLPKSRPHGTRFHEHENKHCSLHNMHYDQCHFDYHPIPNMGANVTLTGFFQSYKYFEGHDEEIKKVFALPKVEGYMDYVSIHWRLGDYVQYSGSFPPLTTDYVHKAMDIFIQNGYKKFIVFSDDITYCKEKLLSTPMANEYCVQYEFSECRTEREDLALMASCGNHIIANSTFSFWGAYLGHNPDRIVISPSAETWFGSDNGVKKPVVDLIPPNWIQIPTR